MTDEEIQLEGERFERRLQFAYSDYQRMHGRRPYVGWQEFHRARFQRYMFWRANPNNIDGIPPSEWFGTFARQDKPPVAKGRDPWGFDEPMRAPA
jgi:hypothetical protein